MVVLAFVSLVIILFATFLFFYLKNRFLHWEKRDVPYLKSLSLLFGNDTDVVLGRLPFSENVLKMYNDLAPSRFGGVFSFWNPVLYVRDPELIKCILVKDFDYFHDRSYDFENEKEPLTMHLFNLTGNNWKILRSKLSHSFTSGKMKMMFQLVKECSENLKIVMDKSVSSGEKLNVKDILARYTTDVISSCAFGLKSNALNDSNSQFRIYGKKIFTPTLKSRIREVAFTLFPNLTKRIGIRAISLDITNFFTNVVRDAFEHRRKNNIKRVDFLNQLINIWEEEKKIKTEYFNFDFGILTAQCFVFFLAGFETSSNALSFILFEVSNHPDVQEKLQKEVDSVLANHNGEITYDALQEMFYMDKVINETERLYPAVPVLLRTCNKNYPIPDSNFVIKKGEVVFIPVVGLHRDSQYFKHPDTFDPEHFSVEAKSLRPHYCFLPFGEGPRICIGLRFGLMQIKLALTMIIKNYNITINPEMHLPLQLMPNSLLTTSKNDILLNGSPRCRKM